LKLEKRKLFFICNGYCCEQSQNTFHIINYGILLELCLMFVFGFEIIYNSLKFKKAFLKSLKPVFEVKTATT